MSYEEYGSFGEALSMPLGYGKHPTRGAGWTEERIEQLKKLWSEGLSGAQIAAILGDGITRNAVIGKVHRLKLTARPKPASTTHARVATRPRAYLSNGRPRLVGRKSHKAKLVVVAAHAATKEHADTGPEDLSLQYPELFIPTENRLALLQLTEHTCKWPIGDPLTADFYFCGQHSEAKTPYCEFHMRRAYYQVEKKRR